MKIQGTAKAVDRTALESVWAQADRMGEGVQESYVEREARWRMVLEEDDRIKKEIEREVDEISQQAQDANARYSDFADSWAKLVSEIETTDVSLERELRHTDTAGTRYLAQAHPSEWSEVDKLSYDWLLIPKPFLNDAANLGYWVAINPEIKSLVHLQDISAVISGVTIENMMQKRNALSGYLKNTILPILKRERPVELAGERLLLTKQIKDKINEWKGSQQ